MDLCEKSNDRISSLEGANCMTALKKLAHPVLDPLFWPPVIDKVGPWTGHIPFAHWLICTMRPRLVVELGVYAGTSYTAFCQAVKSMHLPTRCYGIDTWEGDEHAGYYAENIYNELYTLNDEEFSNFSTLMRTTFDQALPSFEDATIDLLHIDGRHTYDDVKHDFSTWLPKLSDRGVVIFHDTEERRTDFGVWKFWSELKVQYPNFSFLHSHGLGVLCVGAQIAPGVAELASGLSYSQISLVQERFRLLGSMAVSETLKAAAGSEDVVEPIMPASTEISSPLSRRDSILFSSDFLNGKNLEIGPLYRPLILKTEADVIYADHLGTDDIKLKYKSNPEVPLEAIVDVDVVISGQGIARDLSKYGPFSNIVASHVIEHVPDLVGWLSDVSSLLVEGGKICLAVPDKRYTFDIMRRSTCFKDIVDAHQEKRWRPSLDVVCDAFRNSSGVTSQQLWSGSIDIHSMEVGHPVGVVNDAIARHMEGNYVDVHCWVFTSFEFCRLIDQTISLFNLPLRQAYFYDTQFGAEEFHYQLEKRTS
jgi:hypothetical protein